jgi:hypothetical protein
MQEKCILEPHLTQYRSLSKPLGSLWLFGISIKRNRLLKKRWFHDRKITATNQKLPVRMIANQILASLRRDVIVPKDERPQPPYLEVDDDDADPGVPSL